MNKAIFVCVLASAAAFGQERPPAKIIPAGPVTIDPKTARPKIHDKNRLKSLVVKRYGTANILNMPVPTNPRPRNAGTRITRKNNLVLQ
jgi:hypothetical protein